MREIERNSALEPTAHTGCQGRITSMIIAGLTSEYRVVPPFCSAEASADRIPHHAPRRDARPAGRCRARHRREGGARRSDRASSDSAAHAKAAHRAAHSVTSLMPRKPISTTNDIADSETGVAKRRRHIRAVFGLKDRRFPKRHPAIEAMYPGHFLPSSPQMLEELLRRSLQLEQSVIIFLPSARSTKGKPVSAGKAA